MTTTAALHKQTAKTPRAVVAYVAQQWIGTHQSAGTAGGGCGDDLPGGHMNAGAHARLAPGNKTARDGQEDADTQILVAVASRSAP